MTETLSAFENACYLASRGFNVFPDRSRGRQLDYDARANATSDLEALEEIHRAYPFCNWRVRCSRADGLFVLDMPTQQAYQRLIDQLGPLPCTVAVARRGGTLHRWFIAAPDDPDIMSGVPLLGTTAVFKQSAPVPGGRRHWKGSTPEQLPFARLPGRWREGCPTTGTGFTSNVSPRWEWNPDCRAADWSPYSYSDPFDR
jgi:hypothetical protein